MIRIPGQPMFFQNPTPIKGDTIRILRKASNAIACDVGDELFVVSSYKKDSVVYVRCMIKGNKFPSKLSSTSYEWEIIGDKNDLRDELEKINKKLDCIIEFINKIRS